MANEIIKTKLHPQKPADESDIIYPETSIDQVKGLPEPSVGNNNKVIIVTTEGYGTADYNKATKVRVGVTKTLPAGYSASVSNVGTPEEPILEFAIPQGIQGIQGKRGVQGAKGSSIESMNNNGYEVNDDYTKNDISATVINDSLPIDNPDHTLNYHYSVYAKNGELGSPVYYYSNVISGDSVTGLISDLVPTNPVPKQNNLMLTQNGLIMIINSITNTEFTASVVSDLKTFIESAVDGNGRFSKSLIPLTKNDLRIGNSSYPLNGIYTSHLYIMSKTANDTHFLAPLSYEYNSQNDSIFKIEFLDANQVTAEKFGLDFRATRQNSKSEVSFGQYNEDNSFGSTIPKLCLKYEREYGLDGYKQRLGILTASRFIDFRRFPVYTAGIQLDAHIGNNSIRLRGSLSYYPDTNDSFATTLETFLQYAKKQILIPFNGFVRYNSGLLQPVRYIYCTEQFFSIFYYSYDNNIEYLDPNEYSFSFSDIDKYSLDFSAPTIGNSNEFDT